MATLYGDKSNGKFYVVNKATGLYVKRFNISSNRKVRMVNVQYTDRELRALTRNSFEDLLDYVRVAYGVFSTVIENPAGAGVCGKLIEGELFECLLPLGLRVVRTLPNNTSNMRFENHPFNLSRIRVEQRAVGSVGGYMSRYDSALFGTIDPALDDQILFKIKINLWFDHSHVQALARVMDQLQKQFGSVVETNEGTFSGSIVVHGEENAIQVRMLLGGFDVSTYKLSSIAEVWRNAAPHEL